MQAEHEDVVKPGPGRVLERGDGDRARDRGVLARVLDARLGERREVARELAGAGAGAAAAEVAGELAQAREVDEALDDVGARREELVAAQPEPLDQVVHEDVGARGGELLAGVARDREELLDALARLGRELRRLGRGVERADHVDAPPPGDLQHAGDVDRGELDRGSRERAHGGRGVAGVGEQPQPGEHVAHLGAVEERLPAQDAVGDRALGERHGDRLALLGDRRHEHGAALRRDVLAPDQPLELGGDELRLRALVGGAPEADVPRGGAAHVLADARRERRDDRVGGRRARAGAQRKDCASVTTATSGRSLGEAPHVGRRRRRARDRSPGRRRPRR